MIEKEKRAGAKRPPAFYAESMLVSLLEKQTVFWYSILV